MRHVRSQHPNQGWNPHSLHWKTQSSPLDWQGSPLSFFFSLILFTTSISLPLPPLSCPPAHTQAPTHRSIFTFLCEVLRSHSVSQWWRLSHSLFIFLKQLIPFSFQCSLLPLISLPADFLGKCCCQPIRETLWHVASLVNWRRLTGLDFYRELGDKPSHREHMFASVLCSVKV